MGNFRALIVLLLVALAGPCQSLTAAERPGRSPSMFALLDGLVQPFHTLNYGAQGAATHRPGVGFVLGQSFVTAADRVAQDAHALSYLEGEPLWTGNAYPGLNLIVFDVPERLCAHLCNEMSLALAVPPRTHDPVAWMEKRAGRIAVIHAHISTTTAGQSSSKSAGLCPIFLVDRLFDQQAVGSPVVSVPDGKLLGVGVGNVQTPEGRFGKVAPLHCLTASPDRTAGNG